MVQVTAPLAPSRLHASVFEALAIKLAAILLQLQARLFTAHFMCDQRKDSSLSTI